MRPSLVPTLFPKKDPLTVDWVSRVRTKGFYVMPNTVRAVDRLFSRPARTGGLGPLFDTLRLNLGLGESLGASMVPYLLGGGPEVDVPTGMAATDYSEALGWRSDGAATRIDTGTGTSGASSGLMVYLRTTQPSSLTGYNPIGGASTAANSRICANRTSGFNAQAGIVASCVSSQSAGIVGATRSSSLNSGMWHAQHATTAAGSDDRERLFLNGALVGTGASAETFAALSASFPIYVLCLNNQGTAALFLQNNSRVAGYGIYSGFWSAAQIALFYQLYQDLQAALGRQV